MEEEEVEEVEKVEEMVEEVEEVVEEVVEEGVKDLLKNRYLERQEKTTLYLQVFLIPGSLVMDR